MPSTIPYDPSIVLGNIVTLDKLENLKKISQRQVPIDTAEDKLNSLLETKRLIDMTIEELIDIDNKIPISDLQKKGDDLCKDIAEAAVAYANEKILGSKEILELKNEMKKCNAGVDYDWESPVDYFKSGTKRMPLSADSLKMNFHYIKSNENEQDSNTYAAAVKGFVSCDVKELGEDYSAQVSNAVHSQVHNQYSNHKIAGTLVVSIVCTHKDALLLSPFILDVDKAIRVWNKIHRDAMIKPDSKESIEKIAQEANTDNEKCLTIVSGATYGSCFIGMIHVLDETTTEANESMYSVADSLQAQFSIGCWFEKEQGGFGSNSSFSDDIKNLLSTQSISSHCTLVSMGCIPSIKANNVGMAVKQFKNFDGEAAMKSLSDLQNATATDKDTVDASAEKARTGAQMLAMKNSQIKGVLSGLSDIDDKENKIIDMNSLMTALDDYVNKALSGNVGVPINYYLKPITRSQLAEMWVSKYFPGKYISISGDDSESTANKSSSPAAAPK